MMINDMPLGGTIDEALNREAVRRPKSRFAAGALERQVGGEHYTSLPLQPIEFSMVNGLNACQHTAIKYIVREKGGRDGRLQDIDKAIHILEVWRDMLLRGDI